MVVGESVCVNQGGRTLLPLRAPNWRRARIPRVNDLSPCLHGATGQQGIVNPVSHDFRFRRILHGRPVFIGVQSDEDEPPLRAVEIQPGFFRTGALLGRYSGERRVNRFYFVIID